MRDLLAKIPAPDGRPDRWRGATLPPAYAAVKAIAAPAWFVDGGNAAILDAPHFTLQLLRAVGIRYPEKRVVRREAYALLVREREGWHVYRDEGAGSVQETLSVEEEREDAIAQVRHALEREVALACHAQRNGIVVLDGDSTPDGCIALQKTSTELTENGFPLSAVLSATGPWRATLGDVLAVKLHARARHVFLVHGTTPTERDAVVGALAFYSDDLLLPGYPGGLVLADRLARVPNEEREALRVKARGMLREMRERVERAEAATDVHGILDRMG